MEIAKSIKSIMLKNVLGAFCGDTDDQFYHFNKIDKNENGITFNHSVYESLVRYKSVFEKQNYYEWIKYLEKANIEEDSYALANKLDTSTERHNLEQYRNVLIDFKQTRCFYCGRALHDMADKIWNFVLACPHYNTRKSNIIHNNKYFDTIKVRNDRLANVDNPIVREDFKSYSYSKLEEMLHSAIFNGFEYGWRA